MANNWFQHQRQQWIQDHVRAYGCVSTHALSAYFSISPKLARKDLEAFAKSATDTTIRKQDENGVHAVIVGPKTGERVPEHWATLVGVEPVAAHWDTWLQPRTLRLV